MSSMLKLNVMSLKNTVNFVTKKVALSRLGSCNC